jgi:hypothetical protein
LITQRTGGGFQQALLLLLSVPLAVYARKITEACTSGTEAPISRIIGGLSFIVLASLVLISSLVAGHDVGFVHQIAAEYQQNFNADIRTVCSLCSTSILIPLILLLLLLSSFAKAPLDYSRRP